MPETPSKRMPSPFRPILKVISQFDGSPGNAITPPLSAKRDAPPGTPADDVSPLATEGDSRLETISPPLSPLASPGAHKKTLGRRLTASRGGLKIHLSQSTLRQYTEYDHIGTPRSSFFSPVGTSWNGNVFGEPDVQSSLGRIEDSMLPSLPILDVYAMSSLGAILKDSAAGERLRHFAETRGRSNNVDFLLQVRDFNESVHLVASAMNDLSVKFTGVAAVSPVRLPLAVGKNVNGDIREASTTLLPSLELVFDEAKTFVEQSVALDVYPDFLKHQVSLHLQFNGSYSSPRQACAGFGEAFCLTDPRMRGNPMVCVSPGLTSLTGYALKDTIHKNPRIYQGPVTRGSCVDRMREGLAQHGEFTELVLNYTASGSMFWNAVYIAPLVGSTGEVEYYLGGQINVTEMLEREEDLVDVLRYAPPLLEHWPAFARHDAREQRLSRRGSLRERRPERERQAQPKYPPSVSRNKFLKNFRSKYSYTDALGSDTSANASSADVPTQAEGGRPTIPSLCSAPGHRELVSPYSRFMVLEYAKPSSTGGGPHGKHGRGALPLAFCSHATLACFGNDHGQYAVADVVGRDVFDVLSETAHCSSITKSFKSTVRESLAKGDTAKLDISLGGGSRRKRSRGVSPTRKPSYARMGSAAALGRCETPSDHRGALRKSLSLEMLMPSSYEVEVAQDFASYWTPLKDGSGATRWVVLVLVPDTW